ncbi:MAG: hypothetical protein KUL75_04570 [Sterolibacterium sp.]|nr:hypothetical protein [Sterolibacterium sp.]
MNNEISLLRRVAGGLALGGLLLGLATGALADAPAAAQVGEKSQAAKVSPKKYVTDDVLRQGMSHIAELLDASWNEVQAGKLSAPAYRSLADKVEAETQHIVRNCKLDARTDQAFHEILADINSSVELMRRSKPQIQRTGVVALAQTLRNYAKYFEHPGWNGPQPQ